MANKKTIKTEEEKSALEKLYATLNSEYGAGTVIGGKDLQESIEVVNSGSLTLNIATSIGGIPVGKLIEMLGPESSGKSTLALHFISEFQKAGKKCILLDGEQSFDRKYATSIGVNPEEVTFIEPESMEDGYNIVQRFVESGEIGLIIIDSHTSLMPRKVVDGIVGDATIGLQARLNSIFLGKVHFHLKRNGCTIVAISQLRTNIGGYGDPNVATGGLAYKFYSDMRLKVSKQVDKEGSQNKTTVEVIKNKCGAPFRKAEFMIEWGVGVDRMQEILDLAVENKLLSLAGGGWYKIDEDTKVQGDVKMKEFMRNNPEWAQELEKKVLTKIKENA